MLKGDRRLLKQLDMCQIIQDVKVLKEEVDKKNGKQNDLMASIKRQATQKQLFMDLDFSSDDDLPLMQKIKKRLSMGV